MKMIIEKEINLINDTDRPMELADIVPYQRVDSDFRNTAYQYEFLDKKSQLCIQDSIFTMEQIFNAFQNIELDSLEEGQSIYGAIVEQMCYSIGESVTGLIEDMDDEELNKNIIAVKGEKWAKENTQVVTQHQSQ